MNVARCNLPPAKFPVVLEALHPTTRAVVWSTRIEKPEGLAAVYIPPLAKRLGHRVAIRVVFGDGTVQEES